METVKRDNSCAQEGVHYIAEMGRAIRAAHFFFLVFCTYEEVRLSPIS